MPQTGKVVWIGVRPKSREAVVPVRSVLVSKEKGLEGDHYAGKPGSKRQVTLIQEEHLSTVASILKVGSIDPTLTRRNIVVSGINLIALKNQLFKVGKVILQGTGDCAPCSRMEANLGEGGWNAMRGHGGITANVVAGGEISVEDKVVLIADQDE